MVIVGVLSKGCEARGAELRIDELPAAVALADHAGRVGNVCLGRDLSSLTFITLVGMQGLMAVGVVMSNVMRAFCVAGLGSGIALCIFDWLTSVDGVRELLGDGDRGIVATFLPFTIATLALCFNGTSSYFFAMFVRNGADFRDFSASVTTVLWEMFVGYDCVSSAIGLLAIYSGVRINGWDGIREAVGSLGAFGSLFLLVVAALLSLSPFIVSLFGQVLADAANQNVANGRTG